MNKWFTADPHYDHYNILKYCNRPFKDIDHMNKSFIKNYNEQVKPNDIVYMVGDFCFYGDKEGEKNKTQVWEEKLNGKIVHIQGNHDKSKSGKELIISAIMEFGGHKVLVQHEPPKDILDIPYDCSFVICGHSHNAFKYKILEGIPIINVGVDVWNYRPVSIQEILKLYDKIKKEIK